MNNRNNPAGESTEEQIRRALLAEISAKYGVWSESYLESDQFIRLCNSVEWNPTTIAASLDEVVDSEAEALCPRHGFPVQIALQCRRFNAGCLLRLQAVAVSRAFPLWHLRLLHHNRNTKGPPLPALHKAKRPLRRAICAGRIDP